MPHLTLSPLHRADGSATYTDSLHSILAAVNGPVEVQRRDELPEEAYIEVNIRPSSGVGGPRERHLENVVASVLRSVVLVHFYPRMLVQVSLQVLQEPQVWLGKGKAEVALLPALINAAVLALVDGVIGLESVITATLGVVHAEGELAGDPEVGDLVHARSVHAMGFDAEGDLVLDQSTGEFTVQSWGEVADWAQERCVAAVAKTEDEDHMRDDGEERWLRDSLEEKVRAANAWREQT